MQTAVNFFLRAPLLVAAMFLAAAAISRAGETSTPLAALGREVYVAEGCIHCHSQFVRPGTPDVERWGPARDLADVLKESPPLLGNRRQGPDLANVGNRRTAEWNRLHLIAPRTVSPGSRMPNYAHLFRDGEPRGEALLAYLASLGAETLGERAAIASAWTPAAAVGPASSRAPADTQREGRRLFAQLCANCHGPSGRGDGPLAASLSLPPPDWPAHGWRRLDPSASDSALDTALARLVKFGAPGTPMAGHETLTERELFSLVACVRTLKEGGR